MFRALARRRIARAARARHNDFDHACAHWWGDRRPDPGDWANRDLNGRSTSVMDRRCLICRPRTRAEADALIAADPFDMPTAQVPATLRGAPRRIAAPEPSGSRHLGD